MSKTSDLVAAARAELLLTTITGRDYDARGRPTTGHWGAAWLLLDEASREPLAVAAAAVEPGEAFGSPAVVAPVVISAQGISSAEAFGAVGVCRPLVVSLPLLLARS